MNYLYNCLGISKQSFHQKVNRQMAFEEERVQLISMIEDVRKDHPALSARKMYGLIRPIHMGRDAFERLCLDNGYRVQIKRNFMRTTNSIGVKRFDNLITGKELTGVNQVFASDITYYQIGDIFYYLTFIVDLYSRKIKGYAASKNLLTINTSIPALRLLKSNVSKGLLNGSIFHSDGGGQYFCKDFLELTREMGMKNSMGYCVYENAHAERVNGIVKNEYLKYYAPTDFNSLQRQLKRAVENYNNRPHQALLGVTPNEYERLSSEKKIKTKMQISSYKETNPFDLLNKGNVDSEPVKGKINGPRTQANPSPPLTEPESTLKCVYKVKRTKKQTMLTNV